MVLFIFGPVSLVGLRQQSAGRYDACETLYDRLVSSNDVTNTVKT